ncbi:MAG TPA: sugar transferase [Anaerolineales bacterium]|nr:sugar transferase [Anaerolineales bacterium]
MSKHNNLTIDFIRTPGKVIRFGDIAKRLFDILVAFFGLLFLSPIFGFIALAIKRDSPGPVFYWGPRAGLRGKLFRILKFRTMFETPDSYNGPKVTAQNDPRITSLGKWLRDTKLNEFPQLWNVLIGEMSLVGPRPEDPEIVEKWPKPFREEVLSIRPGITSPASIQYHDEESLLSSNQVMQTYLEKIGPSKLRMDVLYVRNRSFWVDLDVILWTVLVVAPNLSSQDVPEELIFWGPMTRFVRRYLNWFTIDTFISILAFSIAWLITRPVSLLGNNFLYLLIGSFWFTCLFSLAGVLFGVNRVSWSKAKSSDVIDVFFAWGLATIIMLVASLQISLFHGKFLGWASGLAFLGFVNFRYRSRLVTGFLSQLRRIWHIESGAKEKAIIIGAGKTGEIAAWMLENPAVSKLIQVIGYVDDDFHKQGLRIYGVEVIGRLADIPDLVAKHDAGIVIYTLSNGDSGNFQNVLDLCRNTQAQIVMLPDIVSFLEDLALMEAYDLAQQANKKVEVNPLRSKEDLPCQQCLIHYAFENREVPVEVGEEKNE